MKQLLKLPIYGLTTCLIASCGSGPEYQEPAYEIKKLPVEAPVVEVAQPDFEIPGVTVSSPETPLLKPNSGIRDNGASGAVRGQPLASAIPIARSVPGRPGCVFNPYNQNIVDVEGIPSGTKVLDPLDSDTSHIFKVP